MDSHENAQRPPRGRLLMVERLSGGWSVGQVAAAAGVTAKTVRKWRNRFAAEGEAGLRDDPPGRMRLNSASAYDKTITICRSC